MKVNPFAFELPADRWSFTNRETLLPKLEALMTETGRRALLVGRRRMGKTSLLLRAAEKAGIRWIFCDLSTVSNLNEVAQKLLKQMPPAKPTLAAGVLKLLQKYASSVTFGKEGYTLKADLRPVSEAKDLTTLEEVLDFINEAAALDDTLVSVGLDEFQDIRRLGGPRAEWSLRGVIQHHRRINYFFSGSDHRLVNWMTEPHAAFYKQLEVISVGPIAPDTLARWINERARRGGWAGAAFGADVVESAGPCTGDIVRLARVVFRLFMEGGGAPGVVGTAMDEIALGALQEEYVKHWHPLSRAQRAVLRAIAENRPPTASATLRDYGIASASTAAKAIDALIERQILTRDGGQVIFDSPFMRRWVKAHGEA